MKVFDPDAQEAIILKMDPATFGRLIARVIRERPTSQNWSLVNQAIEIATGWSAAHEQVQALIQRIAEGGA